MTQPEQSLTINDYLEGRVTLSELIKYATNKVLTQEGVAYDPIDEVCVYHADNGAKCAVGAVLPEEVDNFYKKSRAKTVLMRQFNVFHRTALVEALSLMQAIHDGLAVPYGRKMITRCEFNERFSQRMSTFEQDYPQFFVTNSPD